MLRLKKTTKLLCLIVLFAFLLNIRSAASADSLLNENSCLSNELLLPIYEWKNQTDSVKNVIVAIHGATLHGRVFDTLATHLANHGYLVLAFDLRGFGSWREEATKFGGDDGVHYTQSMHDLVEILNKVRVRYPHKQVYCLGESLGANMAFWIASEHPELVDGIIASSPCIRREIHPRPRLLVDVARGILDPNRECPLEPHLKPYISDDKRVTEDYLNDPLIRHELTIVELIKSIKTNANTLANIEKIPASMPVLIIAGKCDKIYNVNGLNKLLPRLGSQCQTVDIEEKKGHLLLETVFIDENILTAIDRWLQTQDKDNISRVGSDSVTE